MKKWKKVTGKEFEKEKFKNLLKDKIIIKEEYEQWRNQKV